MTRVVQVPLCVGISSTFDHFLFEKANIHVEIHMISGSFVLRVEWDPIVLTLPQTLI